MLSLSRNIQNIIHTTLSDLYDDQNISVEVQYCDTQFGHFSTNFALVNSKLLKQKPIDIANNAAKSLKNIDVFSAVEVVEPGFINITLTSQFLNKYIDNIYSDLSSYIGSPGAGKRVVMDYSHPNIGKPMGVHHLLSTVIGDSIKRLYRQLGYEVIADNFIGDMGTQFGKLIHAVKTWGNIDEIEKNPVPELQKLYVKFHILADSDDSLDDAGRLEYKKLEEGDPENRELLKKIQQWSKADMQAVYDQLNIEFDYMNGESFYEDKLKDIISLGIKSNKFVKSQDALVYVPKDKNEPPAIIQKKDGTSLYLTRDLARIKYWDETWHPDIMMVVVDLAQSLQLKQLFEIADALKLTKAKNVHVGFGRMSFKDGSMSTRKGNIVLISQLIEETKSRVEQIVSESDSALNNQEKEELVQKLTINCIKYNILRQNRLSNIVFDWGTILSLDGNSALYLAYTMSRMQSIKHTVESSKLTKTKKESSGLSGAELELNLEITKVCDVLFESAKQYEPSDIASYCYSLAQLYNRFYHKYRIVEDSSLYQDRLLLNNTALEVMQKCFSILGLKNIRKM